MICYQFLYNPCIHESGSITISIHLTKKGAWDALKAHKIERYNDWLRLHSRRLKLSFEFGRHERWYIEPIEIKP